MKNNIEDKQISSINTSGPEIISQSKYTGIKGRIYHFRFIDSWLIFCKLIDVIY